MPKPLLKAGIVVVASAAPVGRPPLVALTLTISEVTVPVQPLQNNSTSSLVSVPLTVGMNVCPHQAVVDMAFPELLESTTVKSTCSPPTWPSFTSPGLLLMSTLLPVPVEKSPKVVSVVQKPPPTGASAKSCTVVPPPVTTTPFTEVGL